MPASSPLTPPTRRWWDRLGTRDPGGLGLGRGLRCALVGPVVFAFSIHVIGNDALALCAVFGSCAALLFADFGGSLGSRTAAYLLLGVVGALLLGLGTWVSDEPVAAVVLTFVVVAMVRFLANLGPRWAAAMSPTILAYVLGALVPAPTSVIPDRMLGWLMGLVAAAIAAAFILPNRTSVRVDAEAARTADVLVCGLETLRQDGPDAARSDAARSHAVAHLQRARRALRAVSLMPSRPSGAGADAVARRQILDRLTRVTWLLERALQKNHRVLTPDLDAVAAQAIDTLVAAAAVLRSTGSVQALTEQLAVRDSVRDLNLARHVEAVRVGTDPAAVVHEVDAGFAIRASAWHADAAARNVAFLGGVSNISTASEPVVLVPDPSRAAAQRRVSRFLGVHAVPSSVWFRDAARAGVALGVSVGLAFALDVQHAFWVALGTLSALRSSAFATGRTAVSAASGTAVGFGLAALAFAAIGLDDPVFWVLLVLGFFGAGYLPPVSGIVAGQAAFTVAVIALFNILEPVGWQIGLVRLENVALGVGVSALAALLFWPRRLEPLVARLTAAFSSEAGVLLASALEHPADETWPDRRDAVRVAEMRVRAAMAEFLVQLRSEPAVVDPWITRLGAASHARAASDAIVSIRSLITEDGARGGLGDPGLDRVLHVTALELAHDLAPGRGAPDPECSPRVASTTLAAAEAAVAHGRDLAEPVTRSLLARDWLLATAHMVDTRP